MSAFTKIIVIFWFIVFVNACSFSPHNKNIVKIAPQNYGKSQKNSTKDYNYPERVAFRYFISNYIIQGNPRPLNENQMGDIKSLVVDEHYSSPK